MHRAYHSKLQRRLTPKADFREVRVHPVEPTGASKPRQRMERCMSTSRRLRC